jgi:hypothetical protein
MRLNSITCIMLLCASVVCYVPSFGQEVILYSDTWLDDETGYSTDPELQQYYVVSGGTVDMTSSSYHSLRASLMLTDPVGFMSMSFASCTDDCIGTSISFTTAQLLDPDNEADIGDYETMLEVTPVCPATRSEREFISYSVPVGVSFIAMELAGGPSSTGWFRYDKVPGCHVYCNDPQSNWMAPPQASCIQLQIPYVYVCSPIVRVRRSPASCVCFDININ